MSWQYFTGQDDEARDTERLTRVNNNSVPAIRDAVISGFAFEPADIARVATPEVLDQIVNNGLAIRLGDAGFANGSTPTSVSKRSESPSAPRRPHLPHLSPPTHG